MKQTLKEAQSRITVYAMPQMAVLLSVFGM
jgi:hypothetical protein